MDLIDDIEDENSTMKPREIADRLMDMVVKFTITNSQLKT